MLSEKQFRERAKSELRQIGCQVSSLATDRDVYWKLEREIIQQNPQLHDARSPVLDMIRATYADGMTARVLGLLMNTEGSMSLPRTLAQLADYPELLHDKITERELAADREALVRAGSSLAQVVVPHVAHHERTLSALASTNRELDAAIDVIIATVKTYYWIIADCYLDMDVTYSEDPLSIFAFSWALPALAK